MIQLKKDYSYIHDGLIEYVILKNRMIVGSCVIQLLQGNYASLVAEQKRKGYVATSEFLSRFEEVILSSEPFNICIISYIEINEDYRGNGIGQHALNTIMSEYSLNVDYFLLEAKNEFLLVDFYHRFGFQSIDQEQKRFLYIKTNN